MSRLPYPFVSDLVFRAQHQSVDALFLNPVFRLWRVESLDPDTVMAQLRLAIESDTLSSAEKLKLGFLIGYSWPLHYHPQTETLLLLARAHIGQSQVAESLLLWGKLASFYLRDNQLARALEELALALTWAKHHAKEDDIIPLLHWATLIFIRLNQPQDIATFSTAIAALTHVEDDSHFRQSSEYSLAISHMRMGNLEQSQYRLELACQKIQSGKSRLDSWNQTGAVHWLAKLAFAKNHLNDAESLNALSIELNQCEKHDILTARSNLLSYKLARARNASNSANTIVEELAHYQDSTSGDLDIRLNQQITLIRATDYSHRTPPTPPVKHYATIKPAVLKLRQSFRDCMRTFTLPVD